MFACSRLLPALILTALPFAALAAGSDDTEPPKPTQTTTECTDGQVWDEASKTCVTPEDSSLNDDMRFRAVREMAYAGQYDNALRVLAAMQEGESDRVLTYLGFINRKAGRVELGMSYYAQALEVNPDNILARSYMGQSLVEQGEIAMARNQLNEIRARGGAGTWAEASLSQAVGSGQTLSY